MAKVATDFEKMIHSDRSRKKNEALAAKIFGKTKAAVPAAGGKQAARSGIKKRAAPATAAPARGGNINSEWTHDLHDGSNSNTGRNTGRNTRSAAAPKGSGSLASRLSQPGEAPKPTRGGAGGGAAAATSTAPTASIRGRQQRRAAQVANALNRAELQQKPRPQRSQQPAPPQSQQPQTSGLAIRGVAAAVYEPLVIMAQNFAPGTTAADIESVMTPVGGLVSSCRILKTTPLVIAEIVFESREGAERAIATFNNQTADGRLLHVYAKVINSSEPTSHGSLSTQSGPRAQARSKYTAVPGLVDGSLGFDDPMDTDGLAGHLYSDDLIGTQPSAAPGRRGRGRGGRR